MSEPPCSLLLDAYPESAFFIDPGGRILALNRVAAERLDAQVKDLVGTTLWDLLSPDVREPRKEAVQQVVQSRSSALQIDQRDGLWFSVEYRPVIADDGEVAGIAVFARDVTAQITAEEALRQEEASCRSLAEERRVLQGSETKFRKIFENSGDAIFLHEMQGRELRLIEVNPTACSMFGLSRREMFRLPVTELFAPEARTVLPSMIETTLEQGDLVFESVGLRQDGERVPFEGHTHLFDLQGSQVILTVARDISARKQQQKKLHQREQFYRGLFENTGTATIIFGDDRVISSCNAEFEKLSGYPREAVEGVMQWPDFVDEQDLPRMLGYHYRRLESGNDPPPRDYDFLFVDREGRRKNVHIRIGVVKETGERVASFLDISDRVQAEQEVQKKERQYRELYENAPVGIFESTPGGRYLSANTHLAKIYGFESSQDLLESVESIRDQIFVDPEERDEIVRRLATTGFLTNFESRRRRLDGSVIWVSTNMRAVKNAAGEVVSFEGFSTDITEAKNAEEQVRRSEERLNLALDSVSDGIWDWRVDTGEVYFSPRWYTMLGFEPYSMPQSYETWRSLLHPEDAEHAERAIQERIQSASPFEIEFRMRTNDGNWRWILARGDVVQADAQGRAQRLLGMHMDITERKRYHQSLAESEERFEKAFRSSPAPMVISDIETGRFIDVNDKWLQMLGHSREETIGRTSLDVGIWADSSQRKRMIRELKSKGSFHEIPTEFLTRSGQSVWALWSAEKVVLRGEESMLSLIFNITERRQAELALRASEARSQAILNAIPDLIFQVSAEGRFKGFQGRENLLLLPADEFIGKSLEEVLPDFLARKTRQGIDAVFSGQEIYEYEYSLTESGQERYYEARMTTLDRESVLVLVRDVTAQKEA
ncbi:MAG: PAS domain S-box protein, partial [Desulfohalobiaceae bacterium]